MIQHARSSDTRTSTCLIVFMALALDIIAAALIVSYSYTASTVLLGLGLWCLGAWIVSVSIPRQHRRLVLWWYTLGFLIRVVLAASVYLVSVSRGGEGYAGGYIGDDVQWFDLARHFAIVLRNGQSLLNVLSNILQGWVPHPEWGVFRIHPGYVVWSGLIIFFFGEDLLRVNLFNVLLGSLIPVVAYNMAEMWFHDTRTTRIAVILTATYPQFVFYSAINLRDIQVILITSLALWQYYRCRQLSSLSRIALLLGLIGWLYLLRSYLAIVLLIAFGLDQLIVQSNQIRRLLVAGAIVGGALLIVLNASSLWQMISVSNEANPLEKLQMTTTVLASSTSDASFLNYIYRISSNRVLALIIGSPILVGYAILGPLFWTIVDVLRLVMPGIALWQLVLLPAVLWVVVNVRQDPKLKRIISLPLGIYLSLTFGNVITYAGTLERYQLPAMLPLLVFAAYGVVHWRQWRKLRTIYYLCYFTLATGYIIAKTVL